MAMRNVFAYAAGVGFLTLAKAKNMLHGYSSPKPFQISETDRCVAYDLKVVDEWLQYLAAYSAADADLRGRNVLELGPGSDLGVGLYLLAKGAAAYHACDVNDLSRHAPASFYTSLIEHIGAADPGVDTASLKSQIELTRLGLASRLRYVVREDFDLVSAFGSNTMDLVFSQAAFEHFDDVARTVQQLTAVCKPGAIIVAEIDLKTHSRWIRDKDPNNIYRYSDGVYGAFWFRGIPNRMRPYQYRELFERHGWCDVSIIPIEQVNGLENEFSVHRQFKDSRNQMSYLSIVLCARKASVTAGERQL
jgi:SAM-dependent methyltransferase